jgi:hypothetical protein
VLLLLAPSGSLGYLWRHKENDMKKKRWRELMNNPDLELTPEERAKGWHFCPEWDDLLLGPGMEAELEACRCRLNAKAPWYKRLWWWLTNCERCLVCHSYDMAKYLDLDQWKCLNCGNHQSHYDY